jgi:hypothetical protein
LNRSQERQVHAVLIRFSSSIPALALERFVEDQARSLGVVDGLISTTWVADDEIVGGFFVFRSAVAAEDYLHSDAFGDLRGNSAFSHFAIQCFSVIGGTPDPCAPVPSRRPSAAARGSVELPTEEGQDVGLRVGLFADGLADTMPGPRLLM